MYAPTLSLSIFLGGDIAKRYLSAEGLTMLEGTRAWDQALFSSLAICDQWDQEAVVWSLGGRVRAESSNV